MMPASARPCQSVRDVGWIWTCRDLLCLLSAFEFALAPNDLAGYVITIREIIGGMKCRLAFESIAPRYAPIRPEHVLDVGGKRRIGVDVVADLRGREAKAHREAEQVDQFLAGMPDEMRAEDAVGGLIDDDFRPRDGLGIGFRREPVAHVVGVNVDRKSLLPGGRFGQADRGECRHGVDRRRHAGVVGAVFRAFHDVAADDVALIGRDRRELRRGRHRVAADMDERVRGRAQMAVHRDAAVGVFDISGGKIERIDIGDTARAVDDAIGLERLLGAVMAEDDAQAAVCALDPLDADTGLDADADALALGPAAARRRPHPSPAAIAAALREW